MEKLELKHVAPYFNHMQEVVCDDGFRGILMELYLKENENDFECKIKNSEDSYQLRFLEEIKPILHPLSDLIKETEVNDEYFTPIKHLLFDWRKTLIVVCEYSLVDGMLLNIWLDYEGGGGDYISEDKFNIEKFNLLLEWHFDVFGLIEKGLAIDINTLN